MTRERPRAVYPVMRTNLAPLLALAIAGCSSAPPSTNPDACPMPNGTETITSFSSNEPTGSATTCGAVFEGDTWVIAFDGHGNATLESATSTNTPALGATGARTCTGTLSSVNGVRCSNIAVACPAALNKGYGHDLAVDAPLASSQSRVLVTETASGCATHYTATATL
jgi:hypothetical protein